MARGFVLNKGRTRDILLMIALVGGALILPGGHRFVYSAIMKKLNSRLSPAERAINARRLKEIEARRLISIKDISGSKVEVTLTSAGKKLVKLYDIDQMQLPKPAKWDKKWRIVTYDIPATKRKASLALSHKFHVLGMFRIQRSIWVYPYDCKDDIDSLCAIFDINPNTNVCYFVSDAIPKEADAREHFNLP